MFQLNIILLIISLLIYTTIFTLYIEVNYIEVASTNEIKIITLKKENTVLPI